MSEPKPTPKEPIDPNYEFSDPTKEFVLVDDPPTPSKLTEKNFGNPSDDTEQMRRDIIAELTNAYYETYRYERPNDTVELLYAFCRDLAENELDEYTQQLITRARIDELEQLCLIFGSKDAAAPVKDRIAQLQAYRKATT